MTKPMSNEIITHTPNLKDPTENVRNILDMSIQRIDDVIRAELNRVDGKIADEKVRVNESIDAEMRRIDEKIRINSEAAAQLGLAESKRLDAIRSVDINAVSVANERATAQAAVLANQVAASAETLRALVATTAATQAQQSNQVASAMLDRISVLEKSQYEGIGKGRVSDPMINELLLEVKILKENQLQSKGAGSGMEKLWGWIVAAAAVLFAFYNVYKK